MSSRPSSPRKLLWLIIIVLVLGVTYVYYTDDKEPTKPPKEVSQASIIADFRAMQDISIPVEAELGGKFYSTELLFPADFKGQAGEIFYARMEDGHIALTVSYRLKDLTDEVPTTASYEPLEKYVADYTPEGQYVSKSLTGQSLQK